MKKSLDKECKHENEHVLMYKNFTAYCICGDCGEWYERYIKYEEREKAIKRIQTPMTI